MCTDIYIYILGYLWKIGDNRARLTYIYEQGHSEISDGHTLSQLPDKISFGYGTKAIVR